MYILTTVINRIKDLCAGKSKLQPGHNLVFAFSSGGTDYFEFDDVFSMYSLRALTALNFYEKFNQRCSREYLLKHIEAVEKIMSDTKSFSVGKLAILNKQLKERVNLIFDEDLAYELASVIYMDKTEDPYVYDFNYGRKKIEKWKKENSVESFFLRQPLTKLIPSLKDFQGDLRSYSTVAKKIKEQHLESISSM
jgi:hypothetical protein